MQQKKGIDNQVMSERKFDKDVMSSYWGARPANDPYPVPRVTTQNLVFFR